MFCFRQIQNSLQKDLWEQKFCPTHRCRARDLLHGAVQPFSFLFFCGGLRLGFGFYCCGGGALIPQGCSPWNLGHFLLVQKVTKDTLKRRGISIYLRAKSLASLGCAPKRACGCSPFPLDSFPLEPPKTGPAGPFFDLFPGMRRGKVSVENNRKRSTALQANAAKGRRAPK